MAILAWPAGGAGGLDPAGLAALLVSPDRVGAGHAVRRPARGAAGPALLASGIEMTAAGSRCSSLAALTGEWATFDLSAPSPRPAGSGIAYLIVMGSLVGYTTFAWLITVAPLSRVSTYAYVNPVVAVLLGWLVLAEPLTTRTIVASVVIVAAVALIVTGRGRGARTTTDEVAPEADPSPARSRRPS